MKKTCPRCEKSFECKHDEIEKCRCAGIRLDAASLELIKKTYADCLCAECLLEIKEENKKNGKGIF